MPHFGDTGADETHGTWRRVGNRVARSPRRVWIGTAAMLAVMALGLLTIDTGLTQSDAYREKVESIEGQELLAQSFPAGASAATEIIVPDPADVEAVTRRRRGLRRRRRGPSRPTEGDGRRAAQRRARARPVLDRGLRPDPGPARGGQGGGRAGRAGRRAVGDRARRPQGGGARHAADPADRARRRAADPDRAAARGRRAAAADRHGGAVVRRLARLQPRRLRRRLRLRRHRPVAAAVRLRLPRRPGDRLQHLPDDAGPRGDPALRHAQGHAARPGRHRRGHHLGRHRARRHLLRAGRAAARRSSPRSAS